MNFARVIIPIIIVVFSFHFTSLYAQKSEERKYIYHDYELDYLPHFTRFSQIINQFSAVNGEGFSDVLFKIIKSCGMLIFEIKLFPGRVMRTTGLLPHRLSTTTWIIIEFNENGECTRLEIRNKYSMDVIETCIKETINRCKINPALSQNKPVNCILFYTIK